MKRTFRISDSKLFYNVSKFGNENEVDIPFENISGDKVSHKSTNHYFLLISVFIYLIALAIIAGSIRSGTDDYIAGIIWGSIATIFLLMYFYSKMNFWRIRLANDSFLYIHKNIPNRMVADEFIKDLMTTRNDFLKENYATIDENLDYESQLNNFKWLKSINALSRDEFNQKYSELKQTVRPKKAIGFGLNKPL